MTRRRAHHAVLAVTTVLAIAAGLWQVVPPAPPRSPAPHEFDLDRATAHVRAIAKEPHPNGSRANAAVREYLLDQLRALGLDPQIQTRQVRRRWDDSIRTVHNIVARIPASKSTGTGALLLTAHYDSSANAPGAGDDAAGVAAILETLRALKAANHPPARDLIILLSDGEELGLLGAKAFCGDPLGDPSIPSGATQPRPVKEDVGRVHSGAWPPHPWLKDISMVLGFEARGAAGPSIMFEASPGNLNLIRHFAKAAPHPVASSLSYEVYKLIRNDTDFTIFRRAGLRGLNFAFIADQLHYHRRTDTPENLSPRSLFHHGTYALALTRHFSENAEQPEHRDAVWFNPWRGVLAYYPATWVWPLTAVQFLLAAAALFAASRNRAVTGRGLLGATLRLLLSLALAAAFDFTMQRLLAPAPVVRRPWHFEALAALFSAIAAAVAAATMLPWLRRTRPADLIALAIIVWMLPSILASVFAPGATYLTLWPTLPTIALLFVVAQYPDRPRLHTALAALAVAVPLLLFTPTFYLAYVALGLQFAWPIAIAVALAAWLIVPAFALNHPPPAASAPPAEAPPPNTRTP